MTRPLAGVLEMRWLNRDRAIGYGLILLVAEATYAMFVAAQTHGVFGPVGPGSTDFLSFYTSGRLANQGKAAEIYDISVHQSMQREIYGDPNFNDGLFFFFYPPISVLLFALLARLPYLIAFYVWGVSTTALYAAAMRVLLRDWGVAAAMLSCPVLIVNFAVGQNAALTAGLVGFGTLLVDRRPVIAGALFGLLCYKPHFLIMIPVALVAARNWRALAATIATACCLIALTWWLYGTACWIGFIRISAVSQQLFADGTLGHWAAASIFSGVRLLGGSIVAGYAGQVISAAIAATLVAMIWRRNGPLPERAAVLIAAILMTAPVIMSYDILLASVAMAWIAVAAQRSDWLSWEKPSFVLMWLIMLIGRGLAEKAGIPLLPLIGPALMLIVFRRFQIDHLQRRLTSASAR